MYWPETYWTWTTVPKIVWDRGLQFLFTGAFQIFFESIALGLGFLALYLIVFIVVVVVLELVLLPIAMVNDLRRAKQDIVAREEACLARTERWLPKYELPYPMPEWLKRFRRRDP